MTAVFEQNGIRIQYPENWTLQESEGFGDAVEVQIAAPSGAFWSLVSIQSDVDAEQLMLELLESIDEQYESAEWTRKTEQLGGYQAFGFDTYFYCLDLLVSNQMRLIECDGQRLLVIYQAENRDFDQMELVFGAITVSMLASINESAIQS